MPLILGANTLSAGGYEVDNSLRFNSASSDYLNRTMTTPTNNKIYTWSGWIKKTTIGEIAPNIFGAHSGGLRDCIRFDGGGNALQMIFNEAGSGNLVTTQLLRDVSAWYHIVVAVDTTQATDTNRVKIYLNGSQITSFSTSSYPAQNYTNILNSANPHVFGKNADLSNEFFNGYISETHFIDGQQLTPSDFGEFDEDSGIWKPIAYEGTYGTNGFYLEFKDSSALGDDTSGNSNDFTVNNLTSIDQTTDTPTNNFATLNPLAGTTAITFSEGNCKAVFTAQSSRDICQSGFGVSSGKWYWEVKVNNSYGRAGGITSLSDDTQSNNVGGSSFSWGYFGNDGTVFNNNASIGVSYATYSSNIISTFLDLDNNKLYFAKDGTLQSSTGINITDPASIGDNFYFPAVSNGESSVSPTFEVNFGNPTFSITSSNSDPNGYGNFEYSTTITGDGVSKNFYALNTKNLAEFG